MISALTPTSLRPCPLRLSPLEVARGLRARPGFVWFDSSDEAAGSLSVISCDPTQILRGARDGSSMLREALADLRAQGGTIGPRLDLGLPGPGLFGTVDFDGSWCFGVYPEVLVYRHATDQWWESGGLSTRIDASLTAGLAGTRPILTLNPLWSRDGFLNAVNRALEYIGAGDIYQVNLAQPWASPWPHGGDAFHFYEKLRAFSPAPYSAFLDLGGRQVASASPELFLRMSGRTIRTRPIKGTRPRHRLAQEDERAAYDLITSPKEIAELIMITDLERNDLGQICDFGTVTVPDLLRLERFQQVFHLVSTVEGTLRHEVDHVDALWACLPGGSISGAPKKRALEIINELEPDRRGLYAGAVGYLDFAGNLDFCIAIRSILMEGGKAYIQAGAGIVADSNPTAEYEETKDKARAMLRALELAQTGL